MENEKLNNGVISLEGEVWKVINHPSIGDYSNYAISNFGRVKSRRGNKEKLLKAGKNKGYLGVVLCNGKLGRFLVHRLVATMFIPNLEGKPCVNHKIEGKEGRSMNFVFFKADGSVDEERTTIEWVTYKENTNYGSCIERRKETAKNSTVYKEGRLKVAAKLGKNVYQYDQDYQLVNIYPSLSEAERQTGYSCGGISQCCKGYFNTFKGYAWSYTSLDKEKLSIIFTGIKRHKRVYQYDQNYQLINTFSSTREAARQTGLAQSAISRCCIGIKQKTAYNFIWSYEPLECFQYTLFPLTEKKIS